jgi:hypothetical protein
MLRDGHNLNLRTALPSLLCRKLTGLGTGDSSVAEVLGDYKTTIGSGWDELQILIGADQWHILNLYSSSMTWPVTLPLFCTADRTHPIGASGWLGKGLAVLSGRTQWRRYRSERPTGSQVTGRRLEGRNPALPVDFLVQLSQRWGRY